MAKEIILYVDNDPATSQGDVFGDGLVPWRWAEHLDGVKYKGIPQVLDPFTPISPGTAPCSQRAVQEKAAGSAWGQPGSKQKYISAFGVDADPCTFCQTAGSSASLPVLLTPTCGVRVPVPPNGDGGVAWDCGAPGPKYSLPQAPPAPSVPAPGSRRRGASVLYYLVSAPDIPMATFSPV